MQPDAVTGSPRAALILADGEVPDRTDLDAAWPGWDAGIELVIAADGGARHARSLGFSVDRWVGDADSISEPELASLEAGGTVIHRAARDKDESDAELALLEAVEAGAGAIVMLGALGGPRLDHALANLGLALHPLLDGRSFTIYDAGAARVTRLGSGRGPASIERAGRVGDLVSLLPMSGSVSGVTTAGLQYPLAGESLDPGPARGLSNVRTLPVATVSIEAGRLLLIETPVRVEA